MLWQILVIMITTCADITLCILHTLCFSTTIQRYLPDNNTLAMVPKSSGIKAGDIPSIFIDSINRDIEGVKVMPENLDYNGVREFLDTIEQCEGQLLLSGIGTYVSLCFNYPEHGSMVVLMWRQKDCPMYN